MKLTVIPFLFILLCISTATAKAASPTDGLKSVWVKELPDTEFDGSVSFLFKARSSGRAVCLFRCGTDKTTYAIEVNTRDTGIGDDYWTPSALYTLYKYNTENDPEVLAKQNLRGDVVAAGLKIYQGFYGLRFTGIDGKQLFEYTDQEISPLCPGTKLEVFTERNVTIERTTVGFIPYPEREVYPIDINAVDTTNAPYSGTWKYLDRVMPAGKVILAGKYGLQLCPDPDSPGDYIAVYTDSARVDDQFWRTGDIKARLHATPFEGHFNVVWYDSRRRRLDDEVSATFETADVLRIDFPLLSTQLRFYRTPNQ